MIKVSIIIVNYKTPSLTVQCVQSILWFETTLNYEIIVVDNDSQDDTEQQLRAIYPNLKWVQMGYNSGFAKANNAGLKTAEGNYILFLNSDTILIEPIFQNLINSLDENRVGLVSCKMLNMDKTLQLSYYDCNHVFKNIWRRNPFVIKCTNVTERIKKEKRQLQENHAIVHYPDWVSGAVMMLQRKVLENYNLFWDDRFFMYWEDVELCFRLRKLHLKIKYNPYCQLIHLGGGGANVPFQRYCMMEKSKLLFVRKRYGCILYYVYLFLFKSELYLEKFLELRKKHSLDGLLKKEVAFYLK